MGDLVNFNKARKAKLRSVEAATAQANRAKFGRTKAEKLRGKAEMAGMAKTVDGAKLEKD